MIKIKGCPLQFCLLIIVVLLRPAIGWAQFNFTTNNGSLTITAYTGNPFDAVIPSTTNGLTVTSIGNGAFEGQNSLTNITIPSSITNIGPNAFAGCIGLTGMVIPDGVLSIGDMAFTYCSGLTNISIPSGVTRIGNQTFYFCSSLKNIAMGDRITSIGDDAYYNCTNLASLAAPLTNVISIGNSAFYGCASLTNLALPAGVTNVGNYAFNGCASLTSFSIPTNIAWIQTGTFSGCSRLASITIPAPIKNIQDFAFYHSGLGAITIPAGVTNLGNSAFAFCPSLTTIAVETNNPFYSSVAGVLYDENQRQLIQVPGDWDGGFVVPNTVTNIAEEAFWICDKLTAVVIGTNVTSIPPGLFEDCTNLSRVQIPGSVTSIGLFAFLGCSSLINVTLPNGVTNIGNEAFAYCPNLTGIYFAGNAPATVGMDAVEATVYFLAGTTGWQNFSQLTGATTVLWNPQVQPRDPSFGVQSNRFGFDITGSSNLVVIVEATTNLVNPAWTPAGTNTLNIYNGTNGTSYFCDQPFTNAPSRYYRLRSP